MTDLSTQKELASKVLDTGKNSIWLDPERQEDISEAITREDIRNLVDQDAIRAEKPEGNSRGKARERNEKRSYGHQTGPGSRKGKKGARKNPKEDWASRIRAQRKKLKTLRDEGELDRSQYRDLYDKAGGGEFDSVGDLERYINEQYGDA
jgi:large subunit ribosomal protein L19e